MARFVPVDPVYLLPPSVQDWLGKDHMVRFVVDHDTIDEFRKRFLKQIEQLNALSEALGEIDALAADAGYASAHNVACCEAARITPCIATAL